MPVLTHRIRLDLNNIQSSWFGRAAGTARFTYNWGLDRWKKLYESGEKPNWYKLNAELNSRKKVEFPWMANLPWKVPSTALSDLGSAFQHFFRRVKAGQNPGYPKFKKKGVSRESFCIEGRAVSFEDRKMSIPKLGWVRTRQLLRFPGKVLSVRFHKRAGHWYASVSVEVDESRWIYPHHCETQAVIGVDLGLIHLVVLSDGTKIEAPRILRRYEARLKRLGRELSRRTRGGKNWLKTKGELHRLYERVSNLRSGFIHKITADLVRRYRKIGIEDLSVKGMAGGRLAKSVLDAAFAEIRRQLTYKTALAGGEVVIADRFFPSSKTCSTCRSIVEKLPLEVRSWKCSACGTVLDRDVNAAINLKQIAISAAAQAVTACGEERLSTPSSKQESSSTRGLGCVN